MKKMYVGFLLVTQIMCASEPSGNTVSLMQNKTLSSNLSWKELYGVRNKNWNKQQGYHNSIATRQTEIASINKDIEAFKSSGKLNKCNDDLAREYARKFDPTYKGSNHFALERYLGLPVQQQWEQARLSQIPGVFTPQGIVQYLNYQISPQVFDNVKQQNIEKIKADQLQLMSELTVKIDKRKILQEEAQGFEKAIVSCDGIAQECSDVLTQKATGIIGSFVYKKMMNYKAARLIEQDRQEKVEKEAIELGRRNHAELMQPKINTAIKNKEEQKRLAAELIKAQQAQLALKLAREKEAAEKVQLENERRQAQRIKTQADKDAKIAEDLKKDKEKRKENKQKNKEKKSPIQAEKSKKEIALQAQKAKDAADLKYLTDEAIKIELEQKTAASCEIAEAMARRRDQITQWSEQDADHLTASINEYDRTHNLFQDESELANQIVYAVKDLLESSSERNVDVLGDIHEKVVFINNVLYQKKKIVPLHTYFRLEHDLQALIASRLAMIKDESRGCDRGELMQRFVELKIEDAAIKKEGEKPYSVSIISKFNKNGEKNHNVTEQVSTAVKELKKANEDLKIRINQHNQNRIDTIARLNNCRIYDCLHEIQNIIKRKPDINMFGSLKSTDLHDFATKAQEIIDLFH
jgi:hypothetical protein